VTAYPGGATENVDPYDRAATFAGLLNGSTYTFTVASENKVGPSAESDPQSVALPALAPKAPPSVQVTPLDGKAVVHWTASDANGAPITAYLVHLKGRGGDYVAPATARRLTIPRLTNGTQYRATVSALNAVGRGAASESPYFVPYGVPLAPTHVSATAGPGRATITWRRAPSNGSPVLSYVVIASNGTRTTVGPDARQATIHGLPAGAALRFRVKATNAAGVGPASAPSDRVTIG